MYYDRSQPFLVDGKMYWPPVRGIWKEVEGMGYAVHAYGDANGITYRLRKQMKVTNQRKGSDVIAPDVIAKTSSKTLRITMCTVLSRKGVPLEEVSAMAEHSSVEMTKKYIENYDALAVEKRNYSNVVYDMLQVIVRGSRVQRVSE